MNKLEGIPVFCMCTWVMERWEKARGITDHFQERFKSVCLSNQNALTEHLSL